MKYFSPWFLVITALFITCLITANIIAVKLALIGGVVFPAGVIIFPLSYLFGDVLTEVYGYSATRIIIWLGFFCNFIAVIAFSITGALPAAPYWQGQGAYNIILGFAPRLLLASFISYLIGEFVNSFVLAKLKVVTQGRFLWMRTIGSTFFGEGIDTCFFIAIAFWGTLPTSDLTMLIATQWVIKVLYEIVAMPLTYIIVGFLKQREQLDAYDVHTNFNPFRLFVPIPSTSSASVPDTTASAQ